MNPSFELVAGTTNQQARASLVRPLRFEGDVAYVPLTRGLEAVIDAADAEHVSQFNWWVLPKDTRNYAMTTVRRKNIRLHRFLLGDAANGFDVDHVNGDGLDNRRSNIRIATRSQNNMNKGMLAKNRTGFKGVYFTGGSWRARIGAGGRTFYLGSFGSPTDAAAAYAAAASRLHGCFARVA